MIVERKRNREFWLNTLINSIPDISIAAAASYFVDDGFLVFVVVFLGIQLVYFAIWLKNSLWAWARYKLFDEKRGTQLIVDVLRANKFPAPEQYVESADVYLSGIAGNDDINIKTRLIASTELGALSYVQATMRMQEFLRLTLMYDEAIEQYARVAERTSAPPLTAETVDLDDDENEEEQIVMTVKARCEIARARYRDFKETGDEYEREQFERARDKAIEEIKKIKDEFYSGASKHYLISLLVHADKLDEAKHWFAGIMDDFIREKILEDHPELEKRSGET